ncbi:MAG: dihydroorotate dehydrogenase electron transfer subunit [Candidatus Gracilibacteria bacterium]|jgi:dihydroorotate dehydrogenase electron transfer subunit
MQIINTMPKAMTIKEIVQETEQVKTFVLDGSIGAKPGQFVNVWIPRLDEKPFSVAMDTGLELHLSIAAVGPFSNAMHELKVGDKVGVRGPFGTQFTCEKGQHLAFLAGGYGAAPLYFFAHQAVANACTVEFIVGARRKDLLLFTDRISKLKGVRLHTATNDGSDGYSGFNTDVLKKILGEEKIDCVYTVGPEIMMLKGMQMAEELGIDAQISVERYMKCGFGVCGNCCVDGLGVPSCIEGPVMPLEKVKQLKDFGNYHRDKLGKKQYYNT